MEKGNCENCKEAQACVPFFLHENAMMHYNRANKRMLIALITICVTLSIVIAIFVQGNTVRERQLIELVKQHTAEVQNAETATPP